MTHESTLVGASESESQLMDPDNDHAHKRDLPELSFGSANVLERHSKVEHRGRDGRHDQGGPELSVEGHARGDMGVMRELQVVGECNRLVDRNVAVRLEEHETVGVTLPSAFEVEIKGLRRNIPCCNAPPMNSASTLSGIGIPVTA